MSKFSYEQVAHRCAQPFSDFEELGDVIDGKHGKHIFIDNGAKVLAVAHLDTVAPESKQCGWVELDAGWTIFSRGLDDRLGVYTLLDYLPQIIGEGSFDVLLTDGEEKGRSTARDFESKKKYNWMFQFDRKGSQSVMYQYEDKEFVKLVTDAGGKVAMGSSSDIRYLEHLGIKGVNWATGYNDEHTPLARATVSEYISNVFTFVKFYEMNYNRFLEHKPKPAQALAQSHWPTYNQPLEIMTGEEIQEAKKKVANQMNRREMTGHWRYCNTCWGYVNEQYWVYNPEDSNQCGMCYKKQTPAMTQCFSCGIKYRETMIDEYGSCRNCYISTLAGERAPSSKKKGGSNIVVNL